VGMPLLVATLIFSVVYFSPAGHNNHWWSMMLQLDLTNLFVVYALWTLALRPRNVSANILAAAAGWAATYTLTNGLVLMVALGIVAHLPRPRLLHPGRFTVFWAVNLVAVFATYLHGLPEQPGARPGPIDLVRFVFVYLGAPVGELIHYPFHGIFDLPRTTWFNGTIGAVMLAVSCFLCVHAWRRMRAADAAALLL